MAGGADLLNQLCALADAWAAAKGRERDGRSLEVEQLVASLTEADRGRLVQHYLKLPRSRRKEVHQALISGDTVFGPVVPLLRDIQEGEKAWVDQLPDPPAIGERRTAEEWEQIFLRDGFAAELARDMAADLTVSPEDLMRDFYAEGGLPPDQIEEALAQDRRARKWLAANDAVEPAAQVDRMRQLQDAFRDEAEGIAKLAETVGKDLAALVAVPAGAAALREGPVTLLLVAVSRVGLAVTGSVPGELFEWREVAYAAGELADAVDKGEQVDPVRIAEQARAITAVARQVRESLAELERGRGRPAKAALDAAEALRSRGLSWSQIAEMLDRRGLRLDPHTADSIRKSVAARQRRGPPATKS